MKRILTGLTFGDIIENEWASPRNPIRFGIFVRHCTVQRSPCLELTDGKGYFWRIFNNADSRNVDAGISVMTPDWQEQLERLRQSRMVEEAR